MQSSIAFDAQLKTAPYEPTNLFMLTCRSTTISEPEARLSISLNQAHDTSGLPPINTFLLSKENDYLILVHLYMSFGKVNPPSSCCCT